MNQSICRRSGGQVTDSKHKLYIFRQNVCQLTIVRMVNRLTLWVFFSFFIFICFFLYIYLTVFLLRQDIIRVIKKIKEGLQ